MDIKIINIPISELEGIIKKAIADVMAEHLMEPTNSTREKDELIGTAEACKLLGGISERTMQRYRDRRLFTIVKVGPHKALYYRSEILAFRDAHTRANRNNLK